MPLFLFSLSPHVSLSLFNSGDAASESLFEGSKLDEHLFVRKIKRYWSLKAMQTRAEMGRATTRRAIPFPICEGRNPLKYKINRPSVRPIFNSNDAIEFNARSHIAESHSISNSYFFQFYIFTICLLTTFFSDKKKNKQASKVEKFIAKLTIQTKVRKLILQRLCKIGRKHCLRAISRGRVKFGSRNSLASWKKAEKKKKRNVLYAAIFLSTLCNASRIINFNNLPSMIMFDIL